MRGSRCERVCAARQVADESFHIKRTWPRTAASSRDSALREAVARLRSGPQHTNDVFEVMRIALLTERIRRTDRFRVLCRSPRTSGRRHRRRRACRESAEDDRLAGSGKKATCSCSTAQAVSRSARAIGVGGDPGGHPSDIESVMITASFVMRDNKVLTLDEQAVLREADAWRRIWNHVDR